MINITSNPKYVRMFIIKQRIKNTSSTIQGAKGQRSSQGALPVELLLAQGPVVPGDQPASVRQLDSTLLTERSPPEEPPEGEPERLCVLCRHRPHRLVDAILVQLEGKRWMQTSMREWGGAGRASGKGIWFETQSPHCNHTLSVALLPQLMR